MLYIWRPNRKNKIKNKVILRSVRCWPCLENNRKVFLWSCVNKPSFWGLYRIFVRWQDQYKKFFHQNRIAVIMLMLLTSVLPLFNCFHHSSNICLPFWSWSVLRSSLKEVLKDQMRKVWLLLIKSRSTPWAESRPFSSLWNAIIFLVVSIYKIRNKVI